MQDPIVVQSFGEERYVSPSFPPFSSSIYYFLGYVYPNVTYLPTNFNHPNRYLGCTGYPADSHDTIWLTVSRSRPLERCPECGGVYKMSYIGPTDDHHHGEHGHDEHHPEPHKDPETFADYVKPEYRYQ